MMRTDPCVLVEGPVWGDAQFYGEWLLAASKAESLWKEAYADQDFRKQIDRVCVCYIPDFGIAATVVIMRLKENRTTFVINVNSEDGEDFTMMSEMGLFVQKEGIYRMAVPRSLNLENVRAAVLKFAGTEDDEFVLHPEYLLTTMPFSRATALQLWATEEFRSNVLPPSERH